MKPNASLLLAALIVAAPPLTTADELLLDAIEKAPPNSAEGLPRPRRGERMAQVRRKYGEPREILPWVGDPPITRWVYDRYTVYFENEYVIDSVVHRP
ncbi:MAG TPA: hypothetical protein ENK50_08110 [Sedimenticola sp.]|nr:hypothetical protein [Sedimenticola sp.]